MLDSEKLKMMVRMIARTRDEEIGCEDCFAQLDRFVDQLLDGKHPEEAMPLVEHHLNICNDCKEEFQALLDALQTGS